MHEDDCIPLGNRWRTASTDSAGWRRYSTKYIKINSIIRSTSWSTYFSVAGFLLMLPLPKKPLPQQGSCGQTGRQISWKLHFQMHFSLSSRNFIQFQVSEKSWKPSWHPHWLWWFLAGRMLCVFCHLRNWLSFLLFCDSIAKINFCFALIEVVCASKLFAEHVHTSFCRPLIWFIKKKYF